MNLRLQGKVQHTAFELNGNSGRFTEIFLASEYRGIPRWTLGGNIPLIQLDIEGDSHFGVGNSVVYGEWRLEASTFASTAFGTQIELPWGSAHGMADNHWVLLPYVSSHIPVGDLFLMVNLGYAQSVGLHSHGDESDEDLVYVNPHESSEVVGRLAFGAPFFEERLQAMATLATQQALVGEGERSFVQSGFRMQFRFNDALAIRLMGEAPITEAKRFENRFMLGLVYDL